MILTERQKKVLAEIVAKIAPGLSVSAFLAEFAKSLFIHQAVHGFPDFSKSDLTRVLMLQQKKCGQQMMFVYLEEAIPPEERRSFYRQIVPLGPGPLAQAFREHCKE